MAMQAARGNVYVFLVEVEEGQIEGQAHGDRVNNLNISRLMLLAQQALPPPVPPRSLKERCCESLSRCCQSPYASALVGTVSLVASAYFFATVKPEDDPLWSKIAYGVGSVGLATSARMFYLAYKGFREAV